MTKLFQTFRAIKYYFRTTLKLIKKCRFRKSCIQGDLETAMKMVQENGTIERIVDKSGWNGLHHAAAEGHLPIVRLCIQSHFKVHFPEKKLFSKFQINARTKEDETALLLASRNGHQEVVDYLIRENADVFAICKQFSTLFFNVKKLL